MLHSLSLTLGRGSGRVDTRRGTKAIKGWLIIFVRIYYGPMNVHFLLEILDTSLKMTEYKVHRQVISPHPLLLLIEIKNKKIPAQRGPACPGA